MKYLLIFLFAIPIINALGQSICPIPIGKRVNFPSKFNISLGGGLTKLYGDLPNSEMGQSFFLKSEYIVQKAVSFGIEGQLGELRATSTNSDPRFVINNYKSVGLFMNLYFFKLFKSDFSIVYDRRFIDNIYIGVGILGVKNTYTDTYRDINNFSTYGPIVRDKLRNIIYEDMRFDESGNQIFIPKWKKSINSLILPSLNIGIHHPINLKINDRVFNLGLIANAQINFSNNDLLDGYFTTITQSNLKANNDVYNFYSLGLSYFIF